MNAKEFYEKIGKWSFDDINFEVERITDWKLYQKIEEYSNEKSLCLDLGTGGGEKLLKFYPQVGYVIGTDYLDSMIKTANENLKMSGKKNVTFTKMDNLNMTFPANLFDLVSARHTIIDAKKIYEILKPGGVVIVQGVDKPDCLELKELFGRGQAYFDETAISDIDLRDLKEAGFEILEVVKIHETEYFKTKEDLLALLELTPILDDFSEEEDCYVKREIELDVFEEYVKTHQTERGIELKRALYGIIAKK